MFQINQDVYPPPPRKTFYETNKSKVYVVVKYEMTNFGSKNKIHSPNLVIFEKMTLYSFPSINPSITGHILK